MDIREINFDVEERWVLGVKDLEGRK